MTSVTFDPKYNPWISLNMFHEPREMNRVWWKTWYFRRGHHSWRLRYIFLTEWQLCAKCVDPGSHRAPRAASNWQLIAHMDPSVSNIEAKLLAQRGVLVVLLPLNKGVCHFRWQEQDCGVSFRTDPSVCDSSSNTGRLISAPAAVVVGGPSKQTSVIRGDEACVDKRFGPAQVMREPVEINPGLAWKPRNVAPDAARKAWCDEGCRNLIRIRNWGTDFALPHRSAHFCWEESCAVCF